MARAALLFRERDVKRLLKAVLAAGVGVARVELDRDGKVIVVARDDQHEPAESETAPADIVL
jgi:hypothetical protein